MNHDGDTLERYINVDFFSELGIREDKDVLRY